MAGHGEGRREIDPASVLMTLADTRAALTAVRDAINDALSGHGFAQTPGPALGAPGVLVIVVEEHQ